MSSSRALPRPSSLPRSRFLDVTQRYPKTLRERCVTSKKRLRRRLPSLPLTPDLTKSSETGTRLFGGDFNHGVFRVIG